MEDLINKIAAATGLDVQSAQEAVGAILGFFQKHAPQEAFSEFLNAIPGGAEAIAASAAEPAKGGGLMGALGGLVGGLGGGAGGLMALASQLSGKGLDMGQMKTVGQEIFAYAEQQIGPEKARAVMKAIPGVGQMM